MNRTILFLCTGNYYRSRFAEILFNSQVTSLWRAESRGLRLNPANQGPLSKHAVEGLARLGISPNGDARFPIEVTDADLEAADHVVAVKEAEHRPIMQERFSTWADRIEYWQIHDLDCAGPVEALSQLRHEVLRLVERLPHGGPLCPGPIPQPGERPCRG